MELSLLAWAVLPLLVLAVQLVPPLALVLVYAFMLRGICSEPGQWELEARTCNHEPPAVLIHLCWMQLCLSERVRGVRELRGGHPPPLERNTACSQTAAGSAGLSKKAAAWRNKA